MPLAPLAVSVTALPLPAQIPGLETTTALGAGGGGALHKPVQLVSCVPTVPAPAPKLKI
jgi:hypothetical protein